MNRANELWSGLTKLNGITYNVPAGAMYLFPKLDLPQRFIQSTLDKGVEPDAEYCMQMLEKNGRVLDTRKWVWSERRNLSFSNDIFAARKTIRYYARKKSESS